MRRGIAVVIVGLVSLAGGCANQARLVNYNVTDGSGTVAVPNNSDLWPTYNMRAAKALIESKVGPNYTIVSEGEVITGQTTRNEQQTNIDPTQNKRNPNLLGERQTTTATSVTQDTKEYRISFVRGTTPRPINDPRGGSGVIPTGGVNPNPLIPSVLPVNAQQPQPRPLAGTSSLRPAVGGADCQQ